MFYPNTMVGTFLSRPNRFLAHVMLDGKEIICHVKNTGRLKELLLPGTAVVVQHHPDAAETGRKTEYSLIKVAKGDTWVNIDSQAPNQAAFEWLQTLQHASDHPGFCPQNIRREVRYGDSRFDLSFIDSLTGKPWLMEVKGVTLDVNGTAKFPDAPTERGIKHLEELGHAAKEGFGTAVLFVIQMKGISAFSPNADRHPAFAEALNQAHEHGVLVLAYDCIVTENALQIDQPVTVVMHE
ncbi:MAG: DNA/RNA nuclease SfsA [Lachnoclostridium sp.]|nr:DNA/RNA nuclease SfsA [Lachnoclostridium sp.]